MGFRKFAPVIILMVAAAALTACGGSDDTPIVTGEPPITNDRPPGSLNDVALTFERVVDSLDTPVFATWAPGDEHMFVAEKTGRVVAIDSSGKRSNVLDLKDTVSDGGEQGLLGIALSPDFGSDGRLYVNYTNRDGDTVLSRFIVSNGAANRAGEEVLLTIEQPFSNHNGGMIAFGPDGRLYVATGDGGSGGDPGDNGQRLDTLLGKLLRLDVSGESGYRTSGNPFEQAAGARAEIWAYGLRNPWRFSFDRETGDLWIGDVGQNAWEEIDFAPATSEGGENYGWNRYEANHTYPPDSEQPEGAFVAPILEYGRDAGTSVTGGYVYRGRSHPELIGTYLYADFVSGRIWGLRADGSGDVENSLLAETDYLIASFAEDSQGELYVIDMQGGVYRLGVQ